MTAPPRALAASLAVVAGGYVAFVGWLAARARRPVPAPPAVPEAELPSVTVVVAARDEEATIGRCLDALLAQDYPPDRLEVVVADDHSADGTAAVVRRYARRSAAPAAAGGADAGEASRAEPPRPAVRYLRVPDPEGPLRGKAWALHTAIEATSADVVLVTDADCAPVPTWARQTARRFADGEAGVVCGLAQIRPRPAHGFDRVQVLDWSLLLGAVSGLAEAGHPATGMGNNMGVRRAAYEAVGGYPALPVSVTEDFVLVRAVAERTPWRVRFFLDPDALVWTLPIDGVAATYVQRRRWARGGLAGKGWIYPVYGALFVSHALPLAALAAAPLAGGVALAAKGLADATLLRAVLRRTGTRVRLRDLLGVEAFMAAYLVTLPVALVLRPRIAWKGRHH
ncbi:glycosyltransferase [Rubrivirga sp. S365]|uniref:Glycosyltransferase n=1 Tax=Rubrivirga litoralis TaxID=3075598 RepID=A0ABU3BMI4_9BACT|nr:MULTISPECIES: glycosyltransferase [unclassified Rubrivirga]MDT0630499.1 glycosyltransferase [Rubrivirga sp. F394]MDT7857523.1 glycosyltransferase [Rubrivirga sp. S365]